MGSTGPAPDSLSEVRDFWSENPVGPQNRTEVDSWKEYFELFDEIREGVDVEPYEFSNEIHGYESAGGKRVLDYGCGNGYVLARYAENGADVVGVDITDKAVELSRKRFEVGGLEGTFLRNDGRTVPLADGSFDIVCSMGVLHHIPDPGDVISELHRVLKPGGEFITMVYHRNSFRYHVTLRKRKWIGSDPFRGKPLDEQVNMIDGPKNPYGTAYTKSELEELLSAFTDHEFRVNKLSRSELGLFNRYGRLLSDRLPDYFVDALAKRIGWNLYCNARKPI